MISSFHFISCEGKVTGPLSSLQDQESGKRIELPFQRVIGALPGMETATFFNC